MALGEPSANLPNELLENLKNKILKEKFSYTESLGISSLRKKICDHYKLNYKINISIENVAVTAGASAGIFMSLLCSFDKGNSIAISRPGYPAYKNIVKALDMKVYYIDTSKEDNFQLTVDLVKSLPANINGLIVSSPSNPCGTIINNHDMKEIIEVCKSKKIKVISDEIYHKVEYQKEKLTTAFKIDNEVLVINSFSKYFLMTGYRLGWILGDKDFIDKIRNIAMNFYLSPSSISQYVAEHVFNYYDYFDNVVLSYLDNRNYLINGLKKLGLTDFVIPKGAFYLYVDISKLKKNSYYLCKKMVQDIGVTLAPGIDFDNNNGKNYVRLSYACHKKEIADSINLIKEWI